MSSSNQEKVIIVLGVMWLTYIVGIVYILNSFGIASVPIILFMSVALVAMSRIISGTDDNDDERLRSSADDADNMEKRKRDRLDAVLRDLSDDELHRLQTRLQNGSIDDALLEKRIVGDDGELLRAD